MEGHDFLDYMSFRMTCIMIAHVFMEGGHVSLEGMYYRMA